MSRRHNAKSPSPVVPPSSATVLQAKTTALRDKTRPRTPPRSATLLLLCLAALAALGSILRHAKDTTSPDENGLPQRPMPQPLSPDELEGDPFLVGVDPALLTAGCGRRPDGDAATSGSFGLPFVASWRAFPTSMESAYWDLVERISPAFASTSGYHLDRANDCNNPEAHIYPFEDLHVTIATFRTKNDPVPADEGGAEIIWRYCIDALRRASERDEWPGKGSELRMKPRAIRLSRRNAIILWEETSGVMDAMRRCLEEEMRSARARIPDKGTREAIEAALSFDVPPIVHSTFLRLWRVPSDPKRLLQTFQEVSIDMLPTEFGVDIGSIALVFEETPCMHVDHNKATLWSIH